MPSKKAQQQLRKHRICTFARAVACVSFFVLAIIGVSSFVRAMTLEQIANENGIPASWNVGSLGNPATITVPMTYWDQRQDDCNADDRQFEWIICRISHSGVDQGIVQSTLGADGLPVPTYTNSNDAKRAGIDETSQNVTGHNPVQPTDNFYRWFHETDLSKRVDREVTFTRVGNNTYTYGGAGIFPMDNVDFSKNDSATKQGHNFHFTAHLEVAMKISAEGNELFEFTGDDDVWVFLNNRLVLDIGGLHEALNGWFRINTDGSITNYVEGVGQKTFDIGLQAGDVVNLNFFYAERSTTESNTKITISNMHWPISADSDVKAKIAGELEDSNSKLVQYNTSVTNRDPMNPLILERLSAYMKETTPNPETEGATKTTTGYLPLDQTNLYYTTTPDDETSWQPVDITAPTNAASGFSLVTPLTMAPAGQAGDTLHFRFFAESSDIPGDNTLINQTNYYTTLNGAAGVTYDYATIRYTVDPLPEPPVEPPVVEPEEPEPPVEPEVPTEPEQPVEPDPEQPTEPETPVEPIEPVEPSEPETPVEPTEPETPAEPTKPETPVEPESPKDDANIPVIPPSDILGDDLVYLPPLGEVAFVPNTGVVGDAVAAVFEQYFADIILSQGFVMATLLIFAGSFAVYFPMRKYQTLPVQRQRQDSSGQRSCSQRQTQKSASVRSKSTKTAYSSRGVKTAQKAQKSTKNRKK